MDTYNKLNAEQPIKGLVIDLRNNGGGSVEAALTMLGDFIPKGQVLMSEHFKDHTSESLSDGPGLLNVPVVCLQNNGTASASEIFIGAMHDYDKAQTVGELSFGKGITQLIYQLPNGSGLRFTQSRYQTPSGFDLHGVGITPDYEVDMDGDDLYQRILAVDPSNDPQLAKAIALLTAQTQQTNQSDQSKQTEQTKQTKQNSSGN